MTQKPLEGEDLFLPEGAPGGSALKRRVKVLFAATVAGVLMTGAVSPASAQDLKPEDGVEAGEKVLTVKGCQDAVKRGKVSKKDLAMCGAGLFFEGYKAADQHLKPKGPQPKTAKELGIRSNQKVNIPPKAREIPPNQAQGYIPPR